MKFTGFLVVADAALQKALGNAGFRRVSAGKWNRRSGDDLNAIWLQKHSSAPTFCVNLGVHYSFLPKSDIEATLIVDCIEQVDCEIQLRLTSEPAAADQWWPVAIESADEIAALMIQRGLAVFDSYRLAGPIATVEAKDIELDSPNMLSSLTKSRACLFLARMHERLGNRDKCLEAATLGIKVAGKMAVGPRKALKDILKRNASA